MTTLNETHDAALTSWVASANDGATGFPVQNLPYAVFRRRGSQEAFRPGAAIGDRIVRSEEHTSELQSLMRISYAVFCLKKKKKRYKRTYTTSDNTYDYRK